MTQELSGWIKKKRKGTFPRERTKNLADFELRKSAADACQPACQQLRDQLSSLSVAQATAWWTEGFTAHRSFSCETRAVSEVPLLTCYFLSGFFICSTLSKITGDFLRFPHCNSKEVAKPSFYFINKESIIAQLHKHPPLSGVSEPVWAVSGLGDPAILLSTLILQIYHLCVILERVVWGLTAQRWGRAKNL